MTLPSRLLLAALVAAAVPVLADGPAEAPKVFQTPRPPTLRPLVPGSSEEVQHMRDAAQKLRQQADSFRERASNLEEKNRDEEAEILEERAEEFESKARYLDDRAEGSEATRTPAIPGAMGR